VQACKSYAKALGAGGDDAADTSSPGDADDDDQKSAFESAKELATVDAWQAFLSNFPSGFYADLRALTSRSSEARTPLRRTRLAPTRRLRLKTSRSSPETEGYAPNGKPLTKLYDIERAESAEALPPGPTPPGLIRTFDSPALGSHPRRDRK
jgi:hypothetical protein